MRIVFMGTPEFAVPSLEKLAGSGHEIAGVFTQPDRPRGRGNKLSPSPVKACAQQYGIPVFQPEKIRRDGVEELADGKRVHPVGEVASHQAVPAAPLVEVEAGGARDERVRGLAVGVEPAL